VFTGTEELSFSAFIRLLISRTGKQDICCTNTASDEERQWRNTKRFQQRLLNFLIIYVVFNFNQNKDNIYLNYYCAVQGIKMTRNHQMSTTFGDSCFEHYLKKSKKIEG
jgi:hypothetical protein